MVAVGVFDEEDLPASIADARGAEDARGGYKKYALLRPDAPARVLAVGLGKRDEFSAERARVAAAIAASARREPRGPEPRLGAARRRRSPAIAEALVEGTILALLPVRPLPQR